MKNILKIVGFIGSLVAGFTAVNYFVISSKSTISSQAAVNNVSAQSEKTSINSKKISRLDKIEQNYKYQPLEDIPVEFVQIATSDVDHGKKIAPIQPAVSQSVRVDQGSSAPFLGSNQVQGQSELPSYGAVSPHDGYYMPEYYGPMNNHYSGKNNSLNNVPSSAMPSDNLASSVAAPAVMTNNNQESDKNADRKKYFRGLNSFDKNNDYPVNTNNVIDDSIPYKKEASPAPAVNQQLNNGLLNSLLNGFLKSVGAVLGNNILNALYNYYSNNSSIDKQDDVQINEKQTIEEQAVNEKAVDYVKESVSNEGFSEIGKEVRDYSQKTAQSENVYQGSGQNTMKPRVGISNTSAVPTELVSAKEVSFSEISKPSIKTPKKIDNSIEEIKNEKFDNKGIDSSMVTTSLMNSKKSLTNGVDVQPLPEVGNIEVSNNLEVKKLESRKGITETILPEEIIELPAQQEAKVSVEPEVIEVSSELVPVTSQPQTYLERIKSLLTSQNTIDSLDKALTTGQGRGLLALGVALPALAISAITPVAGTVTTVVTPAVAMTNTLVPVATTTATSGMLSSMSGAQAVMAAKAFVGLVGFAVSKNPTFLLPK